MNNLLAAFAMDFAAFVVQNIDQKDVPHIRKIILFGSVARGDSRPKSDIDLFFDVTKASLAAKINKIREEFYESDFYRRYWKLAGVHNIIKPMVGNIDEWKDLKISILSDGIILYAKYNEVPRDAKTSLYALIWWNSVKSNTKRVIISRNLYGWRSGNKKYTGLLDKLGGRKIGGNAILVPMENLAPIKALFRKKKTDFMIMLMNQIK